MVKNFPLQFDSLEHQEIKDAAAFEKMTMKDFIKEAIKEKIKRQNK